MPYSLAGIHEKARRAHEHIQEVDRILEIFRKTTPYTGRIDTQIKPGYKVWKIVDKPKLPPLRFNAVVGEAVYAIRSALDHLVWQLVLANNEIPGDWNAFPICTKNTSWSGASGGLKGVSATARALIKLEQPCFQLNTIRHDWYTWLDCLNKIEKHRHLHTVLASFAGGGFVPGIPPGADWHIHQGIIEDETILAYIDEVHSDVNFAPILDVAFGEPACAYGLSVYTTLLNLEFLLEGTLEIMSPCFS